MGSGGLTPGALNQSAIFCQSCATRSIPPLFRMFWPSGDVWAWHQIVEPPKVIRSSTPLAIVRLGSMFSARRKPLKPSSSSAMTKRGATISICGSANSFAARTRYLVGIMTKVSQIAEPKYFLTNVSSRLLVSREGVRPHCHVTSQSGSLRKSSDANLCCWQISCMVKQNRNRTVRRGSRRYSYSLPTWLLAFLC